MATKTAKTTKTTKAAKATKTRKTKAAPSKAKAKQSKATAKQSKATPTQAQLPLTSSQQTLLRTMASNKFAKGATQKQLQAATGIVRISQALNTGKNKNGKVIYSLQQRGFANAAQVQGPNGKMVASWQLTAKGKAAAKKLPKA